MSIAESLAFSTVDRYWRCSSLVAPPVSMSILMPGCAASYWSNSLRIRSGRWLAPPENTRSVVAALATGATAAIARAAQASAAKARRNRCMLRSPSVGGWRRQRGPAGGIEQCDVRRIDVQRHRRSRRLAKRRRAARHDLGGAELQRDEHLGAERLEQAYRRRQRDVGAGAGEPQIFRAHAQFQRRAACRAGE